MPMPEPRRPGASGPRGWFWPSWFYEGSRPGCHGNKTVCNLPRTIGNPRRAGGPWPARALCGPRWRCPDGVRPFPAGGDILCLRKPLESMLVRVPGGKDKNKVGIKKPAQKRERGKNHGENEADFCAANNAAGSIPMSDDQIDGDGGSEDGQAGPKKSHCREHGQGQGRAVVENPVILEALDLSLSLAGLQ